MLPGGLPERDLPVLGPLVAGSIRGCCLEREIAARPSKSNRICGVGVAVIAWLARDLAATVADPPRDAEIEIEERDRSHAGTIRIVRIDVQVATDHLVLALAGNERPGQCEFGRRVVDHKRLGISELTKVS